MSLSFKQEKFEGPLDLLLQLIEEKELSISEISLSKIADEYMESLKLVEERNPDELADFLVVAAKLLLIKSRELLPAPPALEEEGPSLEFQLKMYKIFYEASLRLAEKIKKKKFIFFRDRIPQMLTPRFSPPPSLTAEKLRASFIDVLTRLTPVIKYPEERLKRKISIQEKIGHIRSLMEKVETMRFRDIMKNAADRTEVVVNFLALLELIRFRDVTADQSEEFGEIIITRSPKAPETQNAQS
jgi:segregation and condensation protein A